MKIAIDGPAGSGKSTVAKMVAEELGYQYLDTGAMYRAVTYRALQEDVPLDDELALGAIARDEVISFGDGGHDSVSINGTDVTRAIRTEMIDRNVSKVAAVPAVRTALVDQQRTIASTHDIVMEGRDIATVVFPDAEVKVFLTASPAARARRRSLQNIERGVGETDEAKLLEEIAVRDELDSTREVAPLVPADDATLLDTSDLSIDEVVAYIAGLARDRA